MAAIAYDDLFDRLGKIGKIGYTVAGDQSALPALVTDLIALYENTPEVALIGTTATNQAAIIAPVSQPPAQLSGLAGTTLVTMVKASTPSITTGPAALVELIRQMRADGETVQSCAVAAAATNLATNVGDGVVLVSTKRGDGLLQENLIPETLRIACVQDSYTGSQQPGREQFQLTGQPNSVSIWNYNYPQGSGASQSVQCVDAAAGPSLNSNLLTNSDFEDWSGALATDSLDNWVLGPGVWGTDIQQSATAFTGTRSLQFLPGATNTALYQEFGDGTAGTSVVPRNLFGYGVNFWARALAGTVSAGVLTVELVDDTGTVINDQQGVPNSTTLTLNTLTTSWVAVSTAFRIPDVPPDVMRLRFRISTDLAGDSVLVDQLAMVQFTASVPGGFSFAVLAGSTNWVAGDGANIVTTNDYGGSSYLATFQALFNRLYNMSSLNLLLPSSGTPSQPDTKITA